MSLQAAGYARGQQGKKHRFGFEYMGGLSGKPGLSTANKNAFTIDGKLFKLPTMDMTEGFDPKQTGQIEKVRLRARQGTEANPQSSGDPTADEARCDLSFVMSYKMEADVNAIVVKVTEMYEQGFISGSCQTSSGETYKITRVDALLVFD